MYNGVNRLTSQPLKFKLVSPALQSELENILNAFNILLQPRKTNSRCKLLRRNHLHLEILNIRYDTFRFLCSHLFDRPAGDSLDRARNKPDGLSLYDQLAKFQRVETCGSATLRVPISPVYREKREKRGNNERSPLHALSHLLAPRPTPE